MKLKKRLSLLLAVLLTFSLATTAAAQPSRLVQAKKLQKWEAKLKFKDMAEHWAAAAVARMNTKGFIRGYEDGTFRPKAPVTNEEALAMIVRAVYPGTEVDPEEVMSDMKHWRQVSSPWALNVLAVAVEKGLTTPEEMFAFIPRQLAKRINVARYIARALKNEDVNAENLGLDFIDIDKVDGSDMAMLEKVVALGIFQGNPDGSFQPRKPITRAEMAILLERLDEKVENPVDKSEVKGILEDIDIDGLELAVEVDGDSTTYAIDAGATVFRNNRRADLEELEVGDELLLLLNADGEVSFIGAREVVKEEEVAGVVASVYGGDQPWIKLEINDDEVRKYYLADHVQIKMDDEEADLEDVEGSYAELKLENDLVVSIKAEFEEMEVEGRFLELSGDTITVLIDGEERSYQLADDVEVKIEGDVALTDVPAGSEVELELKAGVVVKLEIEVEKMEVEGRFLELSGDEITVLIDGEERSYQLADDVEVKIEGDVALPDVPAGSEVELELKAGVVVKLEIEVEEKELKEAKEADEQEGLEEDEDRNKDEAIEEDEEEGEGSEIEGYFVKLRHGGIVVASEDRRDTRYYPVDSGAEITIDGDDAGLSNMEFGDELKAEVSRGTIIKLEAESNHLDHPDVKGNCQRCHD